MDSEYTKRLIELGKSLADSVRSRVSNGDIGNDDADLISKAMHLTGYIAALEEAKP